MKKVCQRYPQNHVTAVSKNNNISTTKAKKFKLLQNSTKSVKKSKKKTKKWHVVTNKSITFLNTTT